MTPHPEAQAVRVVFDTPSGEEVSFRMKTNAISLTFDTSAVLTFDLTARLHGAFVEGRNYRRGLDNRVLQKGRVEQAGQPVGRYQILTEQEGAEFLDGIRERIERTGRALRQGTCRVRGAEPETAPQEAAEWLERIAAWDREVLARDGERFLEIYRPVSILPPDQYMSLVIQATEGCQWNRCTFCNFYRDRRFRIRSGEELRAHIEDVKAFLGEGIRLRRGLFLGDANALTVPWEHLQESLQVVREAFPPRSQRGPSGDEIYAFTDAFGAGLRSQAEIATLARNGLRRVYIGLETGHDALLGLVQKEGKAEVAVEAVRRLKAGGVHAGVIVMLGLGGDRYAPAHVRDTVKALDAMDLGRGDLIYFSQLVSPPELEYSRQMAQAGIRALGEPEMAAQMAAIRDGLVFVGADPPKMAIYDIRRFIY